MVKFSSTDISELHELSNQYITQFVFVKLRKKSVFQKQKQ